MKQGFSLARAALFGAVTGMRSMMGTALISRHLAEGRNWHGSNAPTNALSSHSAANLMAVLSAGEVVADKLPGIPARTAPGPLIVRAALGALAGGAASAERRDNVAAGAIVGASAAVAAAFAAYYLRKWLTKELGLPDAAVAVAEDSLAFAVGRHAVSM